MLIEEQGLVKALKHEYRHGGYIIHNQGDVVCLQADNWFVQCEWKQLPRKALATIVEHAGMIPVVDLSVEVKKGEAPQLMMEDMAKREVESWQCGDTGACISYVPMMFLGNQLFQEVDGTKVYGINPIALGIVERNTAVTGMAQVLDSYKALWRTNDGETVIIITSRNTGQWEQMVWNILERIDLHKKENVT